MDQYSMFDRATEDVGQGSGMMNYRLTTPSRHWCSGGFDGDGFKFDDHEATSMYSKGQSEAYFNGHEVQSQLLAQKDFQNARVRDYWINEVIRANLAQVISRGPAASGSFFNQGSDLCDMIHPAPNQSYFSGDSFYTQYEAGALPDLAPRFGDQFKGPRQTPANIESSACSGQQENSTTHTSRVPSYVQSSITGQSSAEMLSDSSLREELSQSIIPLVSFDPREKDVRANPILKRTGCIASTNFPNPAPHYECQARKDQSSSTIHSPATESPLSSPASQEIFCPVCLQQFTGNKRYASQNLARHMKSVCSRNIVVCGYENCNKSFTRKDNLLKHQQDKGHC